MPSLSDGKAGIESLPAHTLPQEFALRKRSIFLARKSLRRVFLKFRMKQANSSQNLSPSNQEKDVSTIAQVPVENPLPLPLNCKGADNFFCTTSAPTHCKRQKKGLNALGSKTPNSSRMTPPTKRISRGKWIGFWSMLLAAELAPCAATPIENGNFTSSC